MTRFVARLSIVLAIASVLDAQAAPVLRRQINQRGDFVLIGNTSAFDCDDSVPSPVVGTVPAPRTGCGPSYTDDAPDVFFMASDTGVTASASITMAEASSAATLALPAGATVTYARLYWGSMLPVGATLADNQVTLLRPGAGGASAMVTANQTYLVNLRYQGTADVTDFVRAQGPGALRVSGITSRDFRNVEETNAFVAWSMVVFYALNSDPQRNLTLFDGLDQVSAQGGASATLSGFRVPTTGFDAKLGVIAYEGDFRLVGDSLLFNGVTMTNQYNPANNFFNASRTHLGTPVSVAGDLPQMSGLPNTMNGIDLDVVDVRPQLRQGDTSASIDATSTLDVFYLGAFITSIATLVPDFATSTKTVRDVNGAPFFAGDVLEYSIVVRNTGSDPSILTVLRDVLPAGVTYVPGSLQIVDGPGAGTLTDGVDSDRGEYVAATRTVTVRLGNNPTATTGGRLDLSVQTTVRFRVTINQTVVGNISNQAFVRAAGLNGAPLTDYATDGDPTAAGQNPTVVVVDRCRNDADCSAPTPVCDTTVSPRVCVQCRTRLDCSGRTPVCNTTTKTCVACAPGNTSHCPDPTKPACTAAGPLAGACTECAAGSAALCGGAKPICLTDLGICGCSSSDGDAECGGPASGVVCNGPNGICVPGCSTAPNRNGCPSSQVCSDQTGALGSCVTGMCVSDAQCRTEPLLRCDTAASPRVCVQCTADSHCSGGFVCDLPARRCQECTSVDASRCSSAGTGAACLPTGNCGCTRDGDCGGNTSGRICDAASSRCVPGCRGQGGNGCPGTEHCTSTTPAPGECRGCLSNADCASPTPTCDQGRGACVACSGDGPPSCTDPSRPACQASGPLAGACTECSASSDSRCTGGRPVCNTAAGVCVACVDNTRCEGNAPFCEPTTNTCVACRGDGAPSCTDPDRPACLHTGECGCTADGECGNETSGRVCDLAVQRCIDGCRGEGGNGCPRGRICDSSTNDIGACNLPRPDGGDADGGSSGGECEPASESNGRACGDLGKGICIDGTCVAAQISGAGCACDTRGGSGHGPGVFFTALFLLGLWRLRTRAARRKRRRSLRAGAFTIAVVVVAISAVNALSTAPARAGRAPIDVEQFRPNQGGRGIFATESPDAHAPGQWNLGLTLHWAKDPLVLRVGDDRLGEQVSHRFTANFLFAVGIARWLELGLAIPVSFYNDQNQGLLGAASIAGLGTMRLAPKVRILREGIHGLGLALQLTLGLPTGNTDAFLGQDNVVFAPAVLLEKGVGPVRFLMNFGAIVRERATYLNLDVGSEMYLRLAMGWRVHDKIELGAALDGSTPFGSPFGTSTQGNPLEIHLGARFLPTADWQVWVGGGPGLTYGFGSPRVRLFAGLMYGPHERDTDGDGIPDRRDRCPKERGPASNQGCPVADKDTDGDGIPDDEDRCPTVRGPRANKGCPWPDTDLDGLPDRIDDCPDEAGPKENKGCPWPDRDKDRTLDRDDKCPDVPGPVDNDGCPYADSDNDGTLDKDDKCPTVFGPKENRGCPWPDRDKDGILDKDDRCPDVPGPRENQGCPWADRDGDGTPDKDDDCPMRPGPKENRGCPRKRRVVITEDEVKILDRVNFRTGSAVILKGSYGILDQVASVLAEAPELARIEIQGHTDDVGSRKSNLRLSRRRAESVRRYLHKKGIALGRLVARGYGAGAPFVKLSRDLSKKELRDARAQNRRVQFKILERSKTGPAIETR